MNKKIVTIQDISCYGQCSITVALPILSSYGFETAILPSAILSTHTSGFKNFTVHDLSDEIPKIIKHWQDEKIKFDCLYSGYLGDNKHFDLVLQMKDTLLNKDGLFVLDPVMGDGGKLYPAFNMDYVNGMTKLIKEASIILPNLTEASLLTGIPYKEKYDEEYIKSIIKGLSDLGAKAIILTGVSYKDNKTGALLYQNGEMKYYEHDKINKSYHGTGDIYASSFIGNLLRTNDYYLSMKKACEFVVACIKNTIDDESHPYGVKFEPLLSEYTK